VPSPGAVGKTSEWVEGKQLSGTLQSTLHHFEGVGLVGGEWC